MEPPFKPYYFGLAIVNDIQSNRKLFATYARRDSQRWRELIGQKITHSIFGDGSIIDLKRSPDLSEVCLYIKFPQEIRLFKIPGFGRDTRVLTLTLSDATIKGILFETETSEMRRRAEVEARKAEQRLLAPERRLAEVEARKAEQRRLAEEHLREERRLAEERRKTEEFKRAETCRLTEEHRLAEEVRIAQIEAERIVAIKRVREICAAISLETSSHKRIALVRMLRDLLIQSPKAEFWGIIPIKVICEEIIWQMTPRKLRISFLKENISNKNVIIGQLNLFKELYKILTSTPVVDRQFLIEQFPDWAKRHVLIIGFLSYYEQADLISHCITHDYDQDWRIEWAKLEWKSKILCAYLAAKTKKHIYPLEYVREEKDILAKFALMILWAGGNPDKAISAFRKANNLLEEYIIEHAWDSIDPIDLSPILPGCQSKVVGYCEARLWATEEDKMSASSRVSRAFCSRKHQSCNLFEPAGIPRFQATGSIPLKRFALKGARLYAECAQHWKDWSLLELLESSGIEPNLPGLRNCEEYVSRLSGWVNRLNEIRQRLRCSKCGQIMRADKSYAKFLAKFNTTVFFCSQGDTHDRVYINACWGCESIIDSRESRIKIKDKGLYLCIHCGSGPQQSDTYTQGDICPKCGALEMDNSGQDRLYTCKNCRHEIRIPESSKLTGSSHKYQQ